MSVCVCMRVRACVHMCVCGVRAETPPDAPERKGWGGVGRGKAGQSTYTGVCVHTHACGVKVPRHCHEGQLSAMVSHES